MSLGLFSARKTKNLVQQKRYQRFELFVYINTRDENLTIRATHQLTLKDQCGLVCEILLPIVFYLLYYCHK